MKNKLNEILNVNSKLIYFGTFITGLFLLVAYHLLPADWHLLAEICKELAMALLVAVVLAFTIEGIAERRHESQVESERELLSRGIFQAIYKRHIPDVVFEEVERCVLNSKVIREQYQVTYTIAKMDNPPQGIPCNNNYANVSLHSNYTLRNLTTAPVQQDIILNVELPMEKQLIDLVEVVQVVIDGDHISKSDLRKNVKNTGSHLQFSTQREIPASSTIKVSVKAKLIKYGTDQEVWSSRIPSDGLELTVNTPGCDYEVCANANHSQKLSLSIDESNMKRWRLDHGIFPYQSVSFWWHPTGSAAGCPFPSTSAIPVIDKQKIVTDNA